MCTCVYICLHVYIHTCNHSRPEHIALVVKTQAHFGVMIASRETGYDCPMMFDGKALDRLLDLGLEQWAVLMQTLGLPPVHKCVDAPVPPQTDGVTCGLRVIASVKASIYIYMYIYIAHVYTYMYKCIFISMCRCVHLCIYVSTYVYTWLEVLMRINPHTYIYIYIYICTCAFPNSYIYVSVFVCACIFFFFIPGIH